MLASANSSGACLIARSRPIRRLQSASGKNCWPRSGIRRLGNLTRNSQNEPFGFISVSSRGGLYTFSPELAGLTDPHYGDMAIGQLPGADLATMLAGPAFQRIWSDIETGTAMCRQSLRLFQPLPRRRARQQAGRAWNLRGQRDAALPTLAPGDRGQRFISNSKRI